MKNKISEVQYIAQINELEKENANLREEIEDLKLQRDGQSITIKQLNEKVAVLKSQLASIKYLNSQKVLDILVAELGYDYGDKFFTSNEDTKMHNVKNAICKLAIPEIDRDKIIKIINDNFYIESGDFTDHLLVYDEVVKQDDVPDKDEAKALLVSYIADEIIKSIGGK